MDTSKYNDILITDIIFHEVEVPQELYDRIHTIVVDGIMSMYDDFDYDRVWEEYDGITVGEEL